MRMTRGSVPKLVIWGLIALFVVAILALARAKKPTEQGGPGRGGPGGGGKGPRVVQVQVQVLAPERIQQKLASTATVLAREEVDLRAEAAGRVVRVAFEEGRAVRKGALLVKINDAELRAQIRQLEYRLKLAQEREERSGKLLGSGAISREEYDVSLQERNSLLAQRDLLQAQLDKTEIRAPFDGIVGLRQVSEGAFVQAGTAIAGLYSVDPLKIDFSIPERHFAQVGPGDTFSVSIEGLPQPRRGKVVAVEPHVDPATRMVRLRGVVSNSDRRIAPGASARVELPLREISDAIMVPTAAVLPDIRGQRVFLFRGGKAVPSPVTVGYRTEERVQIQGDDVKPGDSVIVSGLIQLKPGAPVELAGKGGAAKGGPGAGDQGDGKAGPPRGAGAEARQGTR